MDPLDLGSWRSAAGGAVIVLTLIGVAVGRYPGVRMNRATIALVGAVALVALGVIAPEEAARAVDLQTLGLLFGMMVINANLRLAGFFRLAAARLALRAHSPRALLAGLVATSGVLSALFLNDTVVLALTPLVIEVTAAARLRPVPFLVGIAAAANVGSVATLVGNPQNMLIGVSSGIPFLTFSAALAPVALVGLGAVWAMIALVYRRDLAWREVPEAPAVKVRAFRPLLIKGSVAGALLLGALLAGVPPALAALGAASILLVTRRIKPERVFREIDWSLLVFFAGLFVVTGAVGSGGYGGRAYESLRPWLEGNLAGFAAAAAVLSNLVSNVPAVLLLRPMIGTLADPERSWLALAMATTLAGNLTLLGSVANLLVAELAAARRVRLGFVEYLKAGVPITLLTLAWGVAWLSLRG
ncbi:MAG TPA: anion transporter [Thermoanaerobaculia bacterium]|nr:anion transporter [Thermoanaerobaculia bacterium]